MGGLFSTPKSPPIPPPATMPDPLAEKQAGLRKAAQMQSQKSGRASTILTDFGAPVGSKLGG